jgi:hypothetical protein
MQNYLLYLAFGKEYIQECKYSILKLLEFYNLRPPKIQVHVLTDKPQEFESLIPFFYHFEIKNLTNTEMEECRGMPPNNYRVKAIAIKRFLDTHAGNVLFCDTDTVLLRPLEPLFADITNGGVYMHQFEGEIAADSAFKKLHTRLTGDTAAMAEVLSFASEPKWYMWNSGVVALNHDRKELLADVVKLTDYIYSKARNHTSEQLAISYCLSKAGTIQEAAPYFYHYWNLKEFRQLLKTFFTLNAEESIPNLVKKIRHLDAMTIQHDKNAWEDLPFLQRMLKRLRGKSWKIATYGKRL